MLGNGAYIKDNEVEEDKQDVHDSPHDELQLADYPPGILQCVGQILPLLVYLHPSAKTIMPTGEMSGWEKQGKP